MIDRNPRSGKDRGSKIMMLKTIEIFYLRTLIASVWGLALTSRKEWKLEGGEKTAAYVLDLQVVLCGVV